MLTGGLRVRPVSGLRARSSSGSALAPEIAEPVLADIDRPLAVLRAPARSWLGSGLLPEAADRDVGDGGVLDVAAGAGPKFGRLGLFLRPGGRVGHPIVPPDEKFLPVLARDRMFYLPFLAL